MTKEREKDQLINKMARRVSVLSPITRDSEKKEVKKNIL
jgi:hypothetical protein